MDKKIEVTLSRALSCLSQRCPVVNFVKAYDGQSLSPETIRRVVNGHGFEITKPFDNETFLAICPTPRCSQHMIITTV